MTGTSTSRFQFFYHHPDSNLPIRNLYAKTEAHMEIRVENFLKTCDQKNIKSFIENRENYLFLVVKLLKNI